MAGSPMKKDGERIRRGLPIGGPARVGEYQPVKIPNADRTWHPRAKSWFNSLKASGQRDYFQQSDWEQAKIVCDILTAIYKAEFKRQAQMLETVSSMMSKLGTTEADRRSLLRLELEHHAEEDATPGDIAEDAYANVLFMPDSKSG